MNKHDAGIRNDLIISESQCVRRNIQNHHVVGQITSVLVDDVAHALILRLQCNAFEKFFFFFLVNKFGFRKNCATIALGVACSNVAAH